MWEEEEEQIWESDSVWERLRNQPIYSPPPSTSSVFLSSPQLYFSLLPPPSIFISPTPQLHFSPTTSVLMSPYLDFSPPPTTSVLMSSLPSSIGRLRNLRFLSVTNVIRPIGPIEYHVYSLHTPVAVAPKSPKMVSIGSCLSVVKISRKLSIELLQVLPSVQLPQALQIVIVEEKMSQLLSYSGEFISQDCSLVEERSVEITVEVDATNNGAHGVKAYENFPIVSHSEKKNTRDKFKRNYKSISVLTLEDLQQHFGSKLEVVAKSFGVSKSTLKRKCRRHGISQWPFQPERKRGRLMEVISPSMHEKHDSRL